MELERHKFGDVEIAEVLSDQEIIKNIDDGLDLLGNLYYQGFDRIIVHEKDITQQFFDLNTGLAGEILQKFSNYRIRLAIVGDFSKYTSKSLSDFIFESNNGKQVGFVSSVNDALKILAK